MDEFPFFFFFFAHYPDIDAHNKFSTFIKGTGRAEKAIFILKLIYSVTPVQPYRSLSFL